MLSFQFSDLKLAYSDARGFLLERPILAIWMYQVKGSYPVHSTLGIKANGSEDNVELMRAQR